MPTQLLLHIADCPELLKSRTLVLSSLWNIVAADSRSAWPLFCDNDFDLALVCHSVPDDNYAWLKKHIHLRSPSTPVLRIASADVLQGSMDGQVPDNPPALLDAILRSLHLDRGLRVMKKGA